MDNRPIGMFDSGCGGLTVLSEYRKMLPHEDFIYFGDNARLPYGSKSKETIIEFSKQIVNFLITQNVKMIIIACGTASAYAYDVLKDIYSLPIKDIITPTAKIINDEEVGVIATKGTINSKSWENAIHAYSPNTNVTSIACPLFVPIVEEGLCNDEIANLACKMYLKNFEDKNISSLVLGCTHYPILHDTIANVVGENVKLINAGYYSAKESLEYLSNNNMLNDDSHIGTATCFSSDDAKTFNEYCKYFPSLDLTDVTKIDITKY